MVKYSMCDTSVYIYISMAFLNTTKPYTYIYIYMCSLYCWAYVSTIKKVKRWLDDKITKHLKNTIIIQAMMSNLSVTFL